jgi:hypothetical protein
MPRDENAAHPALLLHDEAARCLGSAPLRIGKRLNWLGLQELFVAWQGTVPCGCGL